MVDAAGNGEAAKTTLGYINKALAYLIRFWACSLLDMPYLGTLSATLSSVFERTNSSLSDIKGEAFESIPECHPSRSVRTFANQISE